MDARELRELRKLQIQARLEADIKASTDFIFGRAPGSTPNLNHVVSERAGKLVASACAGTRCKIYKKMRDVHAAATCVPESATCMQCLHTRTNTVAILLRAHGVRACVRAHLPLDPRQCGARWKYQGSWQRLGSPSQRLGSPSQPLGRSAGRSECIAPPWLLLV